MKKYISLGLLVAAGMLASCDSFLQREPISFNGENAYFQTADQFALSVNAFYEYLPTNSELWGGLYTADITSDNQAGNGYKTIFLSDGNYKTVAQSSSEWNFSNLRAINFFIGRANQHIDTITVQRELANHYLGEGYWFRAYDQFRLLRNFGDAPILDKMLTNDESELTEYNKRYPRNVVARWIISDLETAASLMQDDAPASGRLCKDAAYALISRVALFEATWEKYHAGTCFAPDNDKWVGKVLWKDGAYGTFSIHGNETITCSGSAEGEISYFLDKAIEYSQKVCEDRPTLDADYAGMFNNFESAFSNSDEVILAKYYQNGVLAHSCSAYLKNGGGCGVTRAAVQTFLMTNGLPWYADGSGYTCDSTSYQELQNRDLRLTESVRAAGSFINTTYDETTKKYVNDTIYYYRPQLWVSGNEKSTTGYDLKKWLSNDANQQKQYYTTTAVPIIRAAECYLNYIEAYYLKNGSLGGNCDKYWRELRNRAGVDPDYTKAIAATDLTKENDLATYSHNQLVDVTLYNIRRERRCELLAEGYRYDDLRRWRCLDQMKADEDGKGYQPEGMHLWNTTMQNMYSADQISSSIVSQVNVSEYIHPLQINSTSAAYNGYIFPKQHYLEPIPISEFLLCISPDGVTETSAGKSILYQNPGWPTNADGPADYTYDCE